MELLIAVVCIILMVVFWRIFLPLAVLGAVGIVFLVFQVRNTNRRNEREAQVAADAEAQKLLSTRQRFSRAEFARDTVVRVWFVDSLADPASGKQVPRIAGIQSEHALCGLAIEQRLDRTRLAGIYCSGLAVRAYEGAEVKFDDRDASDLMQLRQFAGGDDVYIPSEQEAGYLPYDEFLIRLATSSAVAFRLKFDGADWQWVRFSLNGGQPALSAIGALPATRRR